MPKIKLFVDTSSMSQEEKERRLKEQKESNNKEYLLLLEYEDDDKYIFLFQKGREITYNYLKDIVGEINLFHSYIISDSVSIKDKITIYEFLKHMSKKFNDTEFDVDDYVGDYDMEDYEGEFDE